MKSYRAAFAFFVASLASGLAFAQDCDSLVVDEAKVFGDKLEDVTKAAQQISQMGVTVFVRTFTSLGSAGSIDRLEASIQDQCVSWQSADGRRKANLVVVMMTLQPHKLIISN